MKTSHLHPILNRHAFRWSAVTVAALTTCLSAMDGQAQAAPADVAFDIAAGGASHLTIDGSPVAVGIAGGTVSISADDAPCQQGGDGEIICGYTINFINLLLTSFVAGGSTFNDGVLQTTQAVHVFSSNGEMTVPAGTPGAFGALMDGVSRFQAQATPTAISMTVDIDAQQASLQGTFVGTLNGVSVDVGFAASAVSPFINLAPIANAGPDFTVQGHGAIIPVFLPGSGIDPAGGEILWAQWVENGAVVGAGMNAIAMLTPGTHTLTLQVFDTFGARGFDTVVVQVAPGSNIGPVGQRMDYYYCSSEFETCAVGGKKYVAFGANGSFVFMPVNGSFACSTATFAADPAPGVTKACYFANYALEAGENGAGSAPASGFDIAYGANGVFTFRRVSGSYTCNNATFGDPIPGIGKGCYRTLPGYNITASEGGTLNGLNQTSVAYGANGQFIFKVLSGNASCGVATFGYDPAPGILKSCYTEFLGAPIAQEGQSFSWSGPVLYGSGFDGNYLSISSTGVGGCDNGTFGGNPDVFASKNCYGIGIIP